METLQDFPYYCESNYRFSKSTNPYFYISMSSIFLVYFKLFLWQPCGNRSIWAIKCSKNTTSHCKHFIFQLHSFNITIFDLSRIFHYTLRNFQVDTFEQRCQPTATLFYCLFATHERPGEIWLL